MSSVQLKITSALASVLRSQGSDWLILEKEVAEGATIGDLLADLAPDYHNFRHAVFDPDTRQISEEVMIILNDSLLQFPDATEARLTNGDRVMLALVFSGG
ncbi:MoaD/ThiS family protein [Chloroflexota bacterium]